MPTPEELIAYLHRIIKTAEHQDEVAQVTNPTLVKDIHFQMGQMMLALINARNTLRRLVDDEHKTGEPQAAIDMIEEALKGTL